MQTVSKTYGAADAEAQTPAAAPEGTHLGRAKVALICVAAALGGAAVASVARVRTRAYVADLVGASYRMGGKNLEPPPHSLKKPCYLEGVCSETCYGKLKDDGTTKYKCAAEGSLGSKWIIIESVTSKKKPGPDSLSGGGDKPDKIMCAMVHRPVCDTEGNWHTNACVAEHQKFKTISSEHVFDNGKCVKRR
jgi:hypothetical protein